MSNDYIISELSRNCNVFKELLWGISKEEYVWKDKPSRWCLLEIVCHLYDEEIDDFRARTKHALETPAFQMPPIDPEGWVIQKKYLDQDYGVSLDKFLTERERSISWLKSLDSPNWSNSTNHVELGPSTAHMFLSNWLAHDHLHIR